VASFAEYAALARHLNTLHRSAEQTAARLAAERGDAETVADRLDQRLTAQYHRLVELGQAIGRPVPPPDAPPSTAEAVAAPPEPAVAPPAAPGAPPGPTPPAAGPRAAGTPYPPLPGAGARRALPTGPAGPAAGAPGATGPAAGPAAGAPGAAVVGPVPGPRGPAEAVSSPSADARRELELARQAADGADVLIVQAETLARRPPLFPTLSPLRRALAVYGSCAGVLATVIWAILSVVELRAATSTFSKATVAVGVFSWSCAGLPTIAFFVGYLMLSIWGKPKMAGRQPRRYARLGFLICFLAPPLAFAIYYGFVD